jgi:hypothetical protein
MAGVLEYSDPSTKSLLYVQERPWAVEKSALRIQRLFRQKTLKPLPASWQSTAACFAKPKAFQEEEVAASGWAAIQRRSNQLRLIVDASNVTWQEWRETESFEVFYYDAADNRWQWAKPAASTTNFGANSVPDIRLNEKVTSCRCVRCNQRFHSGLVPS